MKLSIKRIVFTLISIVALFVYCEEKYDACDIDCPSDRRTGAQCNDGTTSTSTGSGACSGHGGVKCWECQ